MLRLNPKRFVQILATQSCGLDGRGRGALRYRPLVYGFHSWKTMRKCRTTKDRADGEGTKDPELVKRPQSVSKHGRRFKMQNLARLVPHHPTARGGFERIPSARSPKHTGQPSERNGAIIGGRAIVNSDADCLLKYWISFPKCSIMRRRKAGQRERHANFADKTRFWQRVGRQSSGMRRERG
jgi:hypothetical protein